MQRPTPSPLQSRLLAYLGAISLCLALRTGSTSSHSFADAAEVPTVPDYDALGSHALHALTGGDGDDSHIGDAGFGRGGSEGYEPDFAYLDRSLIGRQAAEVDKLTNNEKMERDIDPENTLYFVLEKDQLLLRRAVDGPLEALEARGTDNASEEAVLAQVERVEREGHADAEADDALRTRQTGISRVWLTANTCRQPLRIGNATEAVKNHPQLVMYVSTSSANQKPGPDATENTLTNITGILFESGYASFQFPTTSDVYIGISAPKLEEDWFGSWHFELAASTDGPYHNYNKSDPFLFMIDTDSESTLFTTYDLGDSNSTEAVDRWNKTNPFNMYAFAAGRYTPITGMEHSYCALKEQFNVNATKNFTIDTTISTQFGDDLPKAQFHVRNLENAKTYNGFVVVEGAQQPLDIPGVGTVRGGGMVFQAFNWTTKADDSCQVLSNLEFCDMVAYAVPSNSTFRTNDTRLEEIYDTQAREYYENFNRSLAQVACDAPADSQYSLAQTCEDCRNAYKNWLCLVLIPRCEDWSANEPWLQPRNINKPLPDGSLPDISNMATDPDENYRDRHAFNQSRNPLIDEVIQPGPYKEMKPCDDLCFDLVKACPAQLGFACPNFPARQTAYGTRDKDRNTLTCNFPGAVVRLNAQSGGGRLAAGLGSTFTLVVVGLVATIILWV
ncbi:calcium channel subunit Mid1 [Decorospora gaudefroyi]|uniref:Calcium channel subunit Mid1 n=1 Tax=Decorospora gaudefroyi TaxID=184978 RepID=A0A6A5KG62_9PLEO|nr:calcium channel subunit Mid1 [Decorospora gaudefroyi]